MEKLLRQTKALVQTDFLPAKTEATARLWTTHLEIDLPFRDLKKYYIESIFNIHTYGNGLSFVYKNTRSNIEFTPLPGEDPKELSSWVPLIQFYKDRCNALALHPHPLTEYKEKIEGMKCNKCNLAIVGYRYFSCEFCNGWTLCHTCNASSRIIFNRRIKSKYHPHVLTKLSYHGDRLDGQINCGKCNVVIDITSSICYECMEYSECEKCSLGQYLGDTATLDIDLLNDVLKYDEKSHEYTLTFNNESACPANMNLVTKGYLDLTGLNDKPLDDAYFEVTFLAFNSAEKVGIILDMNHQTQAQLLGHDTTGYLNDGVVYNASLHHPMAALTPIQPGDTVGMGILLDSYNSTRLFVTHNGVMQRLTVPISISTNNKYSFGVCFTKQSSIRFQAHMRGPYLFDLNSVPNYRNERKNYLEEVPREIPLLLLSWLARAPADLVLLRQVCKTWLNYTNDNFIWKALFLKKWPLQNPNLPVASWKRFYRSRLDQMQSSCSTFLHPIENCHKHDDCPLFWQNLPVGQTKHERYCNKCDRTVYSVHKKQFEVYKADGRRVCLIPQKSVGFNGAVAIIGEEQGKNLRE